MIPYTNQGYMQRSGQYEFPISQGPVPNPLPHPPKSWRKINACVYMIALIEVLLTSTGKKWPFPFETHTKSITHGLSKYLAKTIHFLLHNSVIPDSNLNKLQAETVTFLVRKNKETNPKTTFLQQKFSNISAE